MNCRTPSPESSSISSLLENEESDNGSSGRNQPLEVLHMETVGIGHHGQQLDENDTSHQPLEVLCTETVGEGSNQKINSSTKDGEVSHQPLEVLRTETVGDEDKKSGKENTAEPHQQPEVLRTETVGFGEAKDEEMIQNKPHQPLEVLCTETVGVGDHKHGKVVHAEPHQPLEVLHTETVGVGDEKNQKLDDCDDKHRLQEVLCTESVGGRISGNDLKLNENWNNENENENADIHKLQEVLCTESVGEAKIDIGKALCAEPSFSVAENNNNLDKKISVAPGPAEALCANADENKGVNPHLETLCVDIDGNQKVKKSLKTLRVDIDSDNQVEALCVDLESNVNDGSPMETLSVEMGGHNQGKTLCVDLESTNNNNITPTWKTNKHLFQSIGFAHIEDAEDLKDGNPSSTNDNTTMNKSKNETISLLPSKPFDLDQILTTQKNASRIPRREKNPQNSPVKPNVKDKKIKIERSVDINLNPPKKPEYIITGDAIEPIVIDDGPAISPKYVSTGFEHSLVDLSQED